MRRMVLILHMLLLWSRVQQTFHGVRPVKYYANRFRLNARGEKGGLPRLAKVCK